MGIVCMCWCSDGSRIADQGGHIAEGAPFLAQVDAKSNPPGSASVLVEYIVGGNFRISGYDQNSSPISPGHHQAESIPR